MAGYRSQSEAIYEALHKLEVQLTCPICLEQYNNPRILPCFHSFCLDCLRGIGLELTQGNYSLPCPICRSRCELPQQGVDALPPSFTINNLTEVYKLMKNLTGKGHTSCDKCQNEADRYCNQCAKFLCQQCIQQHESDKLTNNHETLSLNEVAFTAYQLFQAEPKICGICIKHNKPLEMFCRSCQELICRLCARVEHKYHQLVNVSGLAHFITDSADGSTSDHSFQQLERIHITQSIEGEEISSVLAEGKGNLFQSNIILHGPPGAGKSSLKRVILGLDPPTQREQNSTGIMEKGARAVSIDKVNMFQVIENEQLINMLAKEVMSSSSSLSKIRPISIFEHVPCRDFAKLSSSQIPHHVPARRSIECIRRILDQQRACAIAAMPIKIYDSRWHHVVDSGGQPQFMDILPLVYRTPPSLNIVVIRLTDSLDDKQEVRFYVRGQNVYTVPDRLSLTNREFIINVCQIASLHHSSAINEGTGSVKPYVMIVGTHLDKLGRSATERLKKLNQDFSKIQKEFSDVLICKGDGEDNIIFPVNTMAVGTEREQYTKEFHDCITEITSHSVQSIEVPLRWFAYGLEIDMDDGVLSIQECEEKGDLLGMKPNDVHHALTYFNKAALVLYYPDIDIVLTKMDPLVGRLSTLIKASFTCPRFYPPAKKERLRIKGLFNKSYLEEVLGNFKDDKLNHDKFLKILEYLKIIVNVDKDEYFLPSALSLESVNISINKMAVASPLVLTLGVDHFLPHGFFFTIAIELLNCTAEGGYKFQLCGGPNSSVEQRRSEIFIKEASGQIPGLIILTNKIKWIKVTSTTLEPQLYCPIIYQAVENAFKESLSKFKLTALIGGSTQIPSAVICPLCPGSEEHYGEVASYRRNITCIKSGQTGRVTEAMSCWFAKESATPKDVDQADNTKLLARFTKQYDVICGRLDSSSATLHSFSASLYAYGLIDHSTKNSVNRKEGYLGAMELIDCVMAKMIDNHDCSKTILGIMEEHALLEDIAKDLKSTILLRY